MNIFYSSGFQISFVKIDCKPEENLILWRLSNAICIVSVQLGFWNGKYLLLCQEFFNQEWYWWILREMSNLHWFIFSIDASLIDCCETVKYWTRVNSIEIKIDLRLEIWRWDRKNDRAKMFSDHQFGRVRHRFGHWHCFRKREEKTWVDFRKIQRIGYFIWKQRNSSINSFLDRCVDRERETFLPHLIFKFCYTILLTFRCIRFSLNENQSAFSADVDKEKKKISELFNHHRDTCSAIFLLFLVDAMKFIIFSCLDISLDKKDSGLSSAIESQIKGKDEQIQDLKRQIQELNEKISR